MAITHADFLTQVRDYTEVDSNVLTDSIIDKFIRATELNVAGQVDYDDLRKYSTSTFTSGNRYVSLPADCMIVRSVQMINGSNRTFLERRDTSFISEYNSGGTTGEPKFWANWDANTLILAPTPDQAYTLEMWYNETPERLSSTNTTTFVSNNAPELLLYGTIAEAYSYLKNPQEMQLYDQKFQAALQAFAQEQMGRKRRDEYTDGVLRLPLRSVDPGGN